MRLSVTAGLLSLALSALPLVAAEPRPVLHVTGQVADGAQAFDISELRALPATTLETSTVVTDGTHRFTGVLLRDLLTRLDADGDMVTAIALNDYAVDIPVSDFDKFDVILAYSMNGEALDRADKGPLWIIYPRDAHAELQDIRYDYRWVWQLSEIEVR